MKKSIHFFLLFFVILGITYYVAGKWDLNALARLSLKPNALLISIGLLAIHFLLACLLSYLLITGKKNIDLYTYQQIYFVSQLGRYIPGKIWMVLGKFEALRRKGFDLYWVAAISIVEMLLMVLGALAVAAGCLAIEPGKYLKTYTESAQVLFGCCIVIILFSKQLINYALNLGKFALKKIKTDIISDIDSIHSGKFILIALGYSLGWILQGVAFFFLMLSLNPRTTFELRFIFIYAISWLTGFFAVFSPSGIGVRESLMILLLSTEISTTEAAVIAMLARVWATGTELGIAFISLLPFRKAPSH